MRCLRVAIAFALPLVGCKALNPAFQDGEDGGGTSNEAGSASSPPTDGSRGSTSDSGSTGRPETTSSGSSSSSGSESSSGEDSTSPGTDTDDPPDLEPFRIPIIFQNNDVSYFDFVARVRLDEPALIDVPLPWLDFRYADGQERAPFEVISYDRTLGELDAWVLLRVWDGNVPTIVDLVVGYTSPAPSSPWDAYAHVWHLDDVDVLEDAAGASQGQFSGYEDDEGAVPGVVGRARQFDGFNDATNIDLMTDPSTTFAAYAWARIDSLPAGEVALFGRNEGPPSDNDAQLNAVDWAVTVSQMGEIRLVMRVNGGTAMATPGHMGAGGWHHYAVISRPNATWLVVDGGFAGALTTPLFTEISVPGFSIGSWNGTAPGPSNTTFEGAVDEVTWIEQQVPDGWIGAVGANQWDPASTYTIGVKQPA